MSISPLPAEPAFGLHLVTLGVADLRRASAFYAAMGLERRGADAEGVAFFARAARGAEPLSP